MKDCVAIYSGLQKKRQVIFEFDYELYDAGLGDYRYIMSKLLKGNKINITRIFTKEEWDNLEHREYIKAKMAYDLKERLNPTDPIKVQKALNKLADKKNNHFITLNSGSYSGSGTYTQVLTQSGITWTAQTLACGNNFTIIP